MEKRKEMQFDNVPVSVGQIAAIGSEPAQVGYQIGIGHFSFTGENDIGADGPDQVATFW